MSIPISVATSATKGDNKLNVKSEILSEIDNLLSEYIAEKDSGSLRHSRESFVLGALEALDWIKNWIEPYDENRLPSDFFDSVLSEIESTRTDRAQSYASQGSGANPEARPGRHEACTRLANFVIRLKDEVHTEGKE